MAETTDNTATLPGIAALPPTTVRQIGSSQVLVDPSSVVKELIDNALDARAAAIFVDIASNTIDSIQVKDTGHGIPQEDRPLVCRRYCTSKIKDFHDLKNVGGRWLGFRGEALASMAEMSSTLEITTRIEGEPVAVRMKYRRDGELDRTERTSAPVGTIIKITDFFKHLPVRKQTTLKDPAKCLAKIRRLIQAYALARPAVRFSLRILRAKSNKGDFVYAPKKDANVEDAVIKIISKECALQCDWTATKTDGFEIHAYLPRPDAIGSKIANLGAFVAVDARPVSTGRGTFRKIVSLFKERLRKCNPKLGPVKEPFFSMNIICPPQSYDPNIEPAKDDLLFEDADLVITAVDTLLLSYYPEGMVKVYENEETVELPIPDQLPMIQNYEGNNKRSDPPIDIHEDALPSDDHAKSPLEASEGIPQWRSSMYGIDEEDLEFAYENQAPIIEEEEGRRATNISNPWTIAMMNSRTKKPANNGQLVTPAKSRGDIDISSSSPMPATTPREIPLQELLTPKTISRSIIARLSRNEELENNTRQLPPSPIQARPPIMSPQGKRSQALPLGGEAELQGPSGPSISQADMLAPRRSFNSARNAPDMLTGMMHPSSLSPRRTQRQQRWNNHQPPELGQPNDNWFGQPMLRCAPSKQTLSQTPRRAGGLKLPLSSQEEQGNIIENRLFSESNTDIRKFFGQAKVPGPSSFTPINNRPREHREKLPTMEETREPSLPSPGQHVASYEPYRALFVNDPRRLNRVRTPHSPRQGSSIDSPEVSEQLHPHIEKAVRPRPNSAEPCLAPYPPLHSVLSNNVRNASRTPKDTNTLSLDDMAKELRAYKEREDLQPHSRIPPPHEKPLGQSRRRRTTDGIRRRPSSMLPLERVPQNSRTHNIELTVSVGVGGIIHYMRKTNLGVAVGNSLEWGYPSTEFSFDVFSSSITEGTVRSWTAKVVQMLEHVYEREDCTDPEFELIDGIRKQLRNRYEDCIGTDMVEVEHVNAWMQQVGASSELTTFAQNYSASQPIHANTFEGNCVSDDRQPIGNKAIHDNEVMLSDFGNHFKTPHTSSNADRNENTTENGNGDPFLELINAKMLGSRDEHSQLEAPQVNADDYVDNFDDDELLDF
ncbi:hypothetical protein P280DRAFT_523576 [Massarina eburnea CBS 473.64]|uniref:DNA mismatch repair protein S5 domain-containing protein n=1 Tax=Massarina eburnea CBS 473.64 TaxID=1395130 RepID=A0A6A6RIG2_9PLEO|nr:hypothetical protein P280DRAFT_523576 [Massarina eburnea CBS 473.64]